MDAFWFIPSKLSSIICRIYRLFLAVVGMIFFYSGGVCQEINSYKTIVSGDFPNPAIWVVWNGSTWNPASSKPNSTNDIYIDQTHTLRLVANEEVKSVFINAETGAGQKLNLNNFNLNIYGTLNAFSGPAPGTPDNAWNSQNWIGNSISSRITFKGDSRVIIRKSSWSAQTTQSRFSVIFEANPGETFTLEAPLKALSFTVRSGILFQKIDTSVIPNACFTLSFNTETTVYGIGPFGNMSIEDGATFISECNANILNRSTSGSISALNFDLQNGGTLILEGNAPKIEAANFQLNGNLIFRGGTSPKSYLGSSYPDAATPQAAKNIELQGNQNLTLPNTLFLFGDLIKSGSGNFITNSTHLILAGSSNQEIKGFSLSIQDLTLSKTGGIFFPKNDLTITRSLTLTQGRIDFEGKNLIFNTSGLGNYSFTGGSWKNMGLLTLSNLPAVLTSSNSTFPFEDSKNGGIRKVQLLGNSPGGSLNISFTEFKGADFDPGFDDSDGSPILYRLFSFFQFSGSNLNSTPIELRISADKLIVDNVDDLRIVCTGYPAPGTHIPGTDPVNLWAIRSLKWEDLAGKNFTVGSYRVLSILPVIWLSEKAETKPQGNLISWTLASEKDNLLFEIYRSEDWEKGWEKVGTIPSKGNSSTKVDYEFLDQTSDIFRSYFYQIRQFDLLGESWSKVLSTEPLKKWEKPHLLIFPNPYSSGKLRLEFPRTNDQYAWVSIQNSSGKSLFNGPLDENTISDFIEPLSPGIYFITIISGSNQYSGKLIKK